MRHRRRGRKLGRNAKHQRALLKSLAANLILTERDAEGDHNPPKVRGRLVTTLEKAKEVRPLVEKCITLARRSLYAQAEAERYASADERGSDPWRSWRASESWQAWSRAMAPAVAARRRAYRLLGSRLAVSILFDEIAPRYVNRPGGYTRILRLSQPRLGDGGTQAILEFVGQRDRTVQRSQKPEVEPVRAGRAATPAARDAAAGGSKEDEPIDT